MARRAAACRIFPPCRRQHVADRLQLGGAKHAPRHTAFAAERRRLRALRFAQRLRHGRAAGQPLQQPAHRRHARALGAGRAHLLGTVHRQHSLARQGAERGAHVALLQPQPGGDLRHRQRSLGPHQGDQPLLRQSVAPVLLAQGGQLVAQRLHPLPLRDQPLGPQPTERLVALPQVQFGGGHQIGGGKGRIGSGGAQHAHFERVELFDGGGHAVGLVR